VDPSETRKRQRAAAVALLMAALFTRLARTVTRGHAEWFDHAVRTGVHAWASPPLTLAMRLITSLGAFPFLLVLGMAFSWRLMLAGRRRAALLLIAATLGGEGFDQALKFLFVRPRPAVFFGLAQPASYSFPSGHSMASACFYGALAMIAAAGTRSRVRRRVIALAAVAVILLVGFSRVYLGVHYPTDVLGGYLAAVAWLALLRGLGVQA
jgi:undecaprenyl-diphosphatase